MTNFTKFPLDSEVKINYPAGRFFIAPWEETLHLVEGLQNEKVSLRTQDGQYFVLPNEFVVLVDQPEEKLVEYVGHDLWRDSAGDIWKYDLNQDVYYNLSRAVPTRVYIGNDWKRLYTNPED